MPDKKSGMMRREILALVGSLALNHKEGTIF